MYVEFAIPWEIIHLHPLWLLVSFEGALSSHTLVYVKATKIRDIIAKVMGKLLIHLVIKRTSSNEEYSQNLLVTNKWI